MPTRGKWTLKASFAYFGARATNPRWSWSAKSLDGTVVVTMWIDAIGCERGRLIYGSPPRTRKDNLGFNERLENLLCARKHCGGRFRVVFTKKKPGGVKKKKPPGGIAACRPVASLVMRITHLDPNTGKFRAESVTAGFKPAWLDVLRRSFPGEPPSGKVTWP